MSLKNEPGSDDHIEKTYLERDVYIPKFDHFNGLTIVKAKIMSAWVKSFKVGDKVICLVRPYQICYYTCGPGDHTYHDELDEEMYEIRCDGLIFDTRRQAVYNMMKRTHMDLGMLISEANRTEDI